MSEIDTPRHLSQDDVLKALAAQTELPQPEAAHLKDCLLCRQRLDRTRHRFQRIGRMAARLAPTPAGAVRIGGRQTTHRRSPRTLWAVGITAAMILLFTTFWPSTQPDTPLATQPTVMISDRELLNQVDALVDNALPAAVRQIAAVAAPRHEEDLIKWIVPSIPEDGDML